MRIREATDADRPVLRRFLSERHSAVVARLGRIVHPGAVDESRRRLKPEIPETGEYGIPLRDEIVLEKEVSEWRP
jgi:hypothetical protein